MGSHILRRIIIVGYKQTTHVGYLVSKPCIGYLVSKLTLTAELMSS